MTQSMEKTMLVKGWKRNKRDRIRIMLNLYRGQEMFSIRKWFKDPATGEIRPTNAGINLTVDQLSRTIAGLKNALRMAKSGDWRK
jgi:hypothetical protein